MKTEPGFRLARRQGRPVLTGNGGTVSQAAYCDYILNDGWEERMTEFIRSGVKVFHLRVPSGGRIGARDFYDSAFWTSDNCFPESDAEYDWSLDRQAEFVLKQQPKALFFIKFMTAPPLDFTEKHPGDMQTDEDGRRYRQASFSSRRLLRQLPKYLQTMITHVERRPWANHVVGYLGMPIGEGIMALNIAGKMFDCSAVNERAFRAWVKQRYASREVLRQAWNDPAMTFRKVRVPRDREWLQKRRTAAATINGQPPAGTASNCNEAATGLFHWLEESNAAPERDYCRFMREHYMQWLRSMQRTAQETFAKLQVNRIFGLDALKQPQIGWQIQSSFDGIGDGQSFPNMFVLTGSWDLGEMLDDPEFQLVWNPADYYARTLGFAYESEGLTDSLAVRGRIALVENDARTYVGAGIKDQGAFRTPVEVRAGLRRNTAYALSRGLSGYWCNVGSSYFHDLKIQQEIRRLTALTDRLQDLPHRETEHAIAFVVDDTSPLYEDFTSGYQTLALILQRIRALAHCGVPYRVFLLSDLERCRLPKYRTWFFPNLFCVTPEISSLLRRTVLRDGNVAIFGPATGITDGRLLGTAGAQDLLGVEFELLPRTTVRHVIVQDQGHRLTRDLPANLIYGDAMSYGPTMVPQVGALEAAGAEALGHANACWFINHAGLFINEFGRGARNNGRPGTRGARDYAVVWSVALPLPASMLRAIARFAGSHIWCEADDVIYASESLAAIHTSKRGRRTLSLPGRFAVTDALTGKDLGLTRSLELQLESPDTRIFILEPR